MNLKSGRADLIPIFLSIMFPTVFKFQKLSVTQKKRGWL